MGIRMGAERKSAVISPENLKLTAYHEGGHALVALKTHGSMPIHKATIVPRGNTLGMVAYLPEKDQMNLSREQLLAHIDICMGGRVAEELIFGKGQVPPARAPTSSRPPARRAPWSRGMACRAPSAPSTTRPLSSRSSPPP